MKRVFRNAPLSSKHDRKFVQPPLADSKVDSSAEPVVEPLRAQERAQLQKELDRWAELKQEDRGRIEERLKTLPPSEDREQLVKEYGRQLLGIKN